MTVAEKPSACPFSQSALIDRHLVDCSTEALRFHAAASYQIPDLHDNGCPHNKSLGSDNLLIASPYPQQSHLLDLDSVSTSNRILAKALTVLKPVRDDYATAPYREAFNWQYVIDTVRELSKAENFHFRQEPETFYIVVFRSRIPPTTDRSHLGFLDEKSHEEAMESGGLLKYWFGTPDVNGFNLATCVWRYHSDAINGSKGDWHQKAVKATRDMYSMWKVDRLQLVIADEVQSWDIVDWEKDTRSIAHP